MIFEYIVGFAVFVLIFLIIVLFFMLLNEKQNRENDETELKNKIKKSHEKLLKGQDNTKKELMSKYLIHYFLNPFFFIF